MSKSKQYIASGLAWLLFTSSFMLCNQDAQAAITFRAASSTGQGSGGTITVTKPAGTVSGDVMVASVTVVTDSSTVATPAGWTLLLGLDQTGTNRSRLYTYTKVAGAAEPASYSWIVSGTNSGEVAGIASFIGVDNITPIDVSAGVLTASSTNQTAPSITTTVANDMLVTVHEYASARTWTPPTGMTEMVDKASRSSSRSGVSMEMNYQLLVAVGPTGTRTATASSSADRGATISIALRPAIGLDHIEIDYPAPPFSTCSATPVTVFTCANAACTSLYTGGASVTLSPGGNLVVIPSGSSSKFGTVFQSTASPPNGTLSAVSVPAAVGATTCKNGSNGTFTCSVNFSPATLTVMAPNLTSGNTVSGTISGCTAQLPAGNNTINFYTAYNNPASGTKVATVNATAIGATAAASTAIVLNFTVLNATTNQASFNLSYPDVGLLNLIACKTLTNCSAPTVSGSDPFTAAPDHFTISSITCGNGTSYTGCIVTSPYANPGTATTATGAVFMKSGYPFSMTVTAYNANNAITPNFGKETSPEGVTLTPVATMPDLATAVAGNLTGTFGAFSGGAASGNAFAYDEVGIMTVSAKLASGNYLASGLKELTTPASVNIGRFIPDRFTVTTDPDSPIVTRGDFLPQTITTVDLGGAAAPTAIIPVAATTGFNVGDSVRIPGAGAGGNAFTANITAIDNVAVPPTFTLNTAIGTSLAGGENAFDEWGSYIGEQFKTQFTLSAIEFNGSTTNNYQGAYAKLNPAAGGNPLGLGAVDSAGPTYNLVLDTSLAATGSFVNGIAAISAPVAVTRGAIPVGPYNSVKIGIAPTTAEADGVRMGTYDLGVSSASSDHTSIMDPLVQNVTSVLYGRMKISNAHGSELLPLPITATIQYWNGTTYVTSTMDSLSSFAAADVIFNNWQKLIPTSTWAAGSTSVVASPVFVSGVSSFKLAAPGVGKTGSVDMTTSVPSYLPSNFVNPARATFGVYKGANEFIYLRENY